jgi:hypothetical protein
MLKKVLMLQWQQFNNKSSFRGEVIKNIRKTINQKGRK